MYFKVSMRHNPQTDRPSGYYRIVESYRNEYDRICHRTLLNVGFVDIAPEKLNEIKNLLNDRLHRRTTLFETQDPQVAALAAEYWSQLVSQGKVDASDAAYEKKKRMVDVDTIRHKDAREVGAEWMCYQALEQLTIHRLLQQCGWTTEQIQLALTQIISRAVYPHSEYRTSRWIKDNSSVCEITGYPIEKVTKDKLYRSALDLYRIKDTLEQHLSTRTNELFDLQDSIILYDLTNTYFEGVKRQSILAQHTKSKSKEKRDDAKIIVLALVVNTEGFIKYSSVFEGKKSDSDSLGEIVDKIRLCTSDTKRATVVLDAGIATEDNLALLQSKGYDYVCVSRATIKDYEPAKDHQPVRIKSKAGQTITLEKVTTSQTSDYVLKVHSTGKQHKEQSMHHLFEERFNQAIQKVKAALSAKGGIKRVDKVERRIGRIIEKYPSMARHHDINVISDGSMATDIIVHKKTSYSNHQNHLGMYFIRTSLDAAKERTVWTIYNTIREIESTFRCLKTDLDLRPIYHHNDQSTLAHLHLGLLAYWLTNTIRHQLKRKAITHSWSEIVRITNTQKLVTTSGQNTYDEIISIRRCTEPQPKVKAIYEALGYKNYPFVKRKSVVHKPELRKTQNLCLQDIDDS